MNKMHTIQDVKQCIHELIVTCHVCERRIYRANDGEVMKVARGSRQAKVNNHYIQLDSYGRFKN